MQSVWGAEFTYWELLSLVFGDSLGGWQSVGESWFLYSGLSSRSLRERQESIVLSEDRHWWVGELGGGLSATEQFLRRLILLPVENSSENRVINNTVYFMAYCFMPSSEVELAPGSHTRTERTGPGGEHTHPLASSFSFKLTVLVRTRTTSIRLAFILLAHLFHHSIADLAFSLKSKKVWFNSPSICRETRTWTEANVKNVVSAPPECRLQQEFRCLQKRLHRGVREQGVTPWGQRLYRERGLAELKGECSSGEEERKGKDGKG